MGPFLQVGGQWEIVQKNGFRVLINITQDQDQLSAFASHSNGRVKSEEAKGFVLGPDFEMTIMGRWYKRPLHRETDTRSVYASSSGIFEGSHQGPEQSWKRVGLGE